MNLFIKKRDNTSTSTACPQLSVNFKLDVELALKEAGQESAAAMSAAWNSYVLQLAAFGAK